MKIVATRTDKKGKRIERQMDDDEKELFLEKSFCLLGLFTEFLFSQWQRQGSNP